MLAKVKQMHYDISVGMILMILMDGLLRNERKGAVRLAATIVKDAHFNMRINKQKKTDLESLYARLGMTLPEAVNIFFENSLLVGGLPFSVRLPRYNKETEAAMQEAKDIMSGKVSAKSYSSARELFDELDAE